MPSQLSFNKKHAVYPPTDDTGRPFFRFSYELLPMISSTISPIWPIPSPRVCELTRQGAESVLNTLTEWLEEIDQAALSTDKMKTLLDDPVLMATARRATQSSLIHWAAANIDNPGAPVAPFLSNDMLNNARELVRLDATEMMFNFTRSAQNTVWQLWMNIAFKLTNDPLELKELLDTSARSIATFVEGTMEAVAIFMRTEREELRVDTHVERREMISSIVEGEMANANQAGRRLDYNFNQRHQAAVIWSEDAGAQVTALEFTAKAIARCAGNSQTLTVVANTATLWVWIAGDKSIDLRKLRIAIKHLPGVRIAIGSIGHGIEGFRHAHIDALNTQRILGRLHSTQRVADFDMVRLASLMMENPDATHHFVTHTLGNLATAAPSLRSTLVAFLNAGCNATEAAELLHVHRNTLLRRLGAVQELLPRPLASNRVHVAVALEALGWTNDNQNWP